MSPQKKTLWGTSKARPVLPETESEQTVGSFDSGDVLLGKSEPHDWFKISSASNVHCETALPALASASADDALDMLGSTRSGLDTGEAAARLKKCGQNVLSSKKPSAWRQLVLAALLDWFNGILVVIAIVNLAISPPQFATFGVIVVMILLGSIIRFWQEHRSAVAAIKLQDGVEFSVRVQRQDYTGNSIEMIVDQKDLVPGDLMFIDPGNTVPADCRVLHASNLSISQSRSVQLSESGNLCSFY